jgi:hypothetical protein
LGDAAGEDFGRFATAEEEGVRRGIWPEAVSHANRIRVAETVERRRREVTS